jgi:recombination protein RecR
MLFSKEGVVKYPAAFEKLVAYFNRFQGIGRKTSERLVFDILARWDENAIREFSTALLSLSANITRCPECRTHIETLPCPFCSHERKALATLCIVASSKDVYAIESTGLFAGSYYVLGGVLSPLHNNGVAGMELDLLQKRLSDEKVTEVIVALDSSLEGDATASFLKERLTPYAIKVTRLASGVPVGATLDFVDKGTLRRALSGRQHF